jgi:hypothetical protein
VGPAVARGRMVGRAGLQRRRGLLGRLPPPDDTNRFLAVPPLPRVAHVPFFGVFEKLQMGNRSFSRRGGAAANAWRPGMRRPR